MTIDRTTCPARRHATESAYSRCGCRCPDAREAWRSYRFNLRHGLHEPRMVDIGPTAERLRVLVGIGYDWRSLARELGYKAPRPVTEMAYMKRGHVYRPTAERVRRLYNELIQRPAPAGFAAGKAFNTAQRNGWGIVDLEVVRRALAGHEPALTQLEKRAVLYTGHARGVTHSTLSKLLRMSGTTVNAALAA